MSVFCEVSAYNSLEDIDIFPLYMEQTCDVQFASIDKTFKNIILYDSSGSAKLVFYLYYCLFFIHVYQFISTQFVEHLSV